MTKKKTSKEIGKASRNKGKRGELEIVIKSGWV